MTRPYGQSARLQDHKLWRHDPALARLVTVLRYRVPALRGASNDNIVLLIYWLRDAAANLGGLASAIGDLITPAEAARRLNRTERHLSDAQRWASYRPVGKRRRRHQRSLGLRDNIAPVVIGHLLFFRGSEVDELVRLRKERAVASATKRMAMRARATLPPGAITIAEMTKRVGVSRRARATAMLIPRMHRQGNRWFTTEADIAAFIVARDALAAQTIRGYRRAADYIGFDRRHMLKMVQRGLIKPVDMSNHMAGWAYRKSDLDDLRERLRERHHRRGWTTEARRFIADVRTRLARVVASEKRSLPKVPKPPVPILPHGVVPIAEALNRAGLSMLQFVRARKGLSGTPIPRFHTTPKGRHYCLPLELAAFLADRRKNGLVVEADVEARRAKKLRERGTETGRERKREQDRRRKRRRKSPHHTKAVQVRVSA